MATREDFKVLTSRKNFQIAVSVFSDRHACHQPTPVIIMGHGIGAVKDAGLAPFAKAFAAHGYAAITFDYLHFGQSDEQPRNLMVISSQLQDFRDVIAWARNQPDRF